MALKNKLQVEDWRYGQWSFNVCFSFLFKNEIYIEDFQFYYQ